MSKSKYSPSGKPVIAEDAVATGKMKFATRAMFALIWKKHKEGLPQTDDEAEAMAKSLADHPEYWPEWDRNVEFNLPQAVDVKSVEDTPVLEDPRFDPDKGEVNPYLHIVVHSVVDGQLKMGLPAVRRAYDNLQKDGHDEHAIRHLIGQALSEELWHVMKEQKPFDESRYERALEQL